jgi:hypothetical protein
LTRARLVEELLLETEPEWRLYEDLSAERIGFRVEAGTIGTLDPDDPPGRAWFVVNEAKIRYAGASGFFIIWRSGVEDYAARVEDVLERVNQSRE